LENVFSSHELVWAVTIEKQHANHAVLQQNSWLEMIRQAQTQHGYCGARRPASAGRMIKKQLTKT